MRLRRYEGRLRVNSRHRELRAEEGNTIQELLKNFSGVLVSDFYAAYDAIECSQPAPVSTAR